jgi:hypothetical protein
MHGTAALMSGSTIGPKTESSAFARMPGADAGS